MFRDLAASRAEVGSLHEQVDALQQKLAMEEASKKSPRALVGSFWGRFFDQNRLQIQLIF